MPLDFTPEYINQQLHRLLNELEQHYQRYFQVIARLNRVYSSAQAQRVDMGKLNTTYMLICEAEASVKILRDAQRYHQGR